MTRASTPLDATNGGSIRPLVPGGKVGENEWNSRLAEALKKLGFPQAQFEPIVKISSGGRVLIRKPDVGIKNGGLHFVSGKLGDRKELEAYRSADEYRTSFEGLKDLGEVFAVTYPSGRGERFHLHILPRLGREIAVSFTVESLEEVATRISDTIKGRIAEIEKFAEPSSLVAPRFLRNAAVELSEAIKGVRDEDLEQVFGGKAFFRSVLQGALPREVRRETLRLGAAFLFANQVFFYVLLSRAAQRAGKPQIFPSIIPGHAKSPADLWDFYFSKVREKDYEPIYGHNVSQFFRGGEASDACVAVVKALLDLAPKLELPDLAGQVFQTLIPFDLRKPLGANYTNPRAAALLASLAIERPEVRVFDPACGSGTLLVAAYNRKKILSKGVSTQTLHKRFLESDLTGIDAMTFAGHLAAVNLALQQPLLETDFVRIGSIDSTTLRNPGTEESEVPETGDALPSEFVQSRLDAQFEARTRAPRSRTVSVTQKTSSSFRVDLQDLVIMNPPFTSRDNMSAGYRDRLAARFSSGEYGRATAGKKISQQAYFLLLADEYLQPEGTVAAVLPLTTLGGKDYWPLVDFLCTNYTFRYLIVGLGRTSFSEETSFSECLLIAEKKRPTKGSTFRLVGTLLPPDRWDHDVLSKLVEGCRRGESANEISIVREFPQSLLAPGEEMLPGLMLRLLPEYEEARQDFEKLHADSKVRLVKFSELREQGIEYRERIEKARHLTELGASAFLACRQRERALRKLDRLYMDNARADHLVFRDRMSNATYSFAREEVVPALRRFAYIKSLDVTSESDFCVRSTGTALERTLTGIYGQKDGMRKYNVLKRKSFWQQVVDRNSARVATTMRVNFGAPGTTLLSCWCDKPMFITHDYLASGFADPREERFFVMWVNSSFSVLQLIPSTSTTEGSFARMERFTLDRIWFPDFRRFSENDWKTSEALWHKLRALEATSLIDQVSSDNPFRATLDDGMLELLGIRDQNARHRMAESIRAGLRVAITALRASMGPGRTDLSEEDD